MNSGRQLRTNSVPPSGPSNGGTDRLMNTLVRHQASLYYLPLLIILHAASYMVFIPGETRKQDDDDERSVTKDKIVHVYILTELDGHTRAA